MNGKHLLGFLFIVSAVYLMSNGKEGWGWFVFGALCCIGD